MNMGRPRKPIHEQQSITKKTYVNESLSERFIRAAKSQHKSESQALREAMLDWIEYHESLTELDAA